MARAGAEPGQTRRPFKGQTPEPETVKHTRATTEGLSAGGATSCPSSAALSCPGCCGAQGPSPRQQAAPCPGGTWGVNKHRAAPSGGLTMASWMSWGGGGARDTDRRHQSPMAGRHRQSYLAASVTWILAASLSSSPAPLLAGSCRLFQARHPLGRGLRTKAGYQEAKGKLGCFQCARSGPRAQARTATTDSRLCVRGDASQSQALERSRYVVVDSLKCLG